MINRGNRHAGEQAKNGLEPPAFVNLPRAKTAHEKTAIERQIAATDRQIDQLVYELHGQNGDNCLFRTADKARHDKMVELVERMLKLHKDLPKAKTAPEKTAFERQIQAADKQTDQLVYELYGLTEEEIRILEAN